MNGDPPQPANEEIVRPTVSEWSWPAVGCTASRSQKCHEALFTGSLTTPTSPARTEAQPTPTMPEDLLQLQKPPPLPTSRTSNRNSAGRPNCRCSRIPTYTDQALIGKVWP
jgi:hypothetical protein